LNAFASNSNAEDFVRVGAEIDDLEKIVKLIG
jgi:hypothetical protein